LERVYIDTCAWCRPFDKPTPRTTKETDALHRILSLADEGKIEIIGSGVVLFEVSMIDVAEKRDAISALIRKSANMFAEVTEEAERLAVDLTNKCKLDSVDSAHIATAVRGNAGVFLTTDDEILDKKDCISKFGIVVKNPADYIKVVQDEQRCICGSCYEKGPEYFKK